MAKKRKSNEGNTNKILIGLAVVLIVFSMVQAFQIGDIKDEIGPSNTVGASAPRSTSGTASSPRPQTSASAMVGGC